MSYHAHYQMGSGLFFSFMSSNCLCYFLCVRTHFSQSSSSFLVMFSLLTSITMSYLWTSYDAIKTAGSRTARRSFEFGKTHVVRPKGKHQATMVWLHGLGDNGLRYECYVFIFVISVAHIAITIYQSCILPHFMYRPLCNHDYMGAVVLVFDFLKCVV